MSTLDDLVSQGWSDHATQPDAVFARLEAGLHHVTEGKHLPTFTALAVHVSGEHLGDCAAGLRLLERLERLPWVNRDSPEAKAVARGQATLHYVAGDVAGYERSLLAARSGGAVPEAADRARVLAVAASALAARQRIAQARQALEQALEHASYGPTANDPVARSLAVTGNNLAAELENRPTRTAEEDALMVRAAETGLRFWTIVGGWEQRQAAHYRLSASLRKAGRLPEALEQARRCQEIVQHNGAPATEAFFAHEALAQAHAAAGEDARARAERAAAAALLAEISDPDWRQAADADLEALDRVLAAARPPAPPPSS